MTAPEKTGQPVAYRQLPSQISRVAEQIAVMNSPAPGGVAASYYVQRIAVRVERAGAVSKAAAPSYCASRPGDDVEGFINHANLVGRYF
jgi:hypothetical protein